MSDNEFEVTIVQKLTKTYTVTAQNREDADIEANNLFSSNRDIAEESVEQDTVSIKNNGVECLEVDSTQVILINSSEIADVLVDAGIHLNNDEVEKIGIKIYTQFLEDYYSLIKSHGHDLNSA